MWEHPEVRVRVRVRVKIRVRVRVTVMVRVRVRVNPIFWPNPNPKRQCNPHLLLQRARSF